MAKNVANKTLRNFAGAFYIGLKLYSMFYPHKLMQKVIQNSGAKHTLVFTNVAGFVKPVLYNGKKLKEMYYLPTAFGSLCTGLTCLSTMDRMKITISSDKFQVDDIDGFIAIFNDLIVTHGLKHEENDRKDN